MHHTGLRMSIGPLPACLFWQDEIISYCLIGNLCEVKVYLQETLSEAELQNFTHTHPIHIADLFTANAPNPTNIQVDYSVEGLSKLLLFNAYAKARSEQVTELIMQEARKYPYNLKQQSEVRKLKTY